jgi:hypothetical protein
MGSTCIDILKTNSPRYNHKEVLRRYGRQKGQHLHPLLWTWKYLHQAKGERRRALLIGLQNGLRRMYLHQAKGERRRAIAEGKSVVILRIYDLKLPKIK